MSLLKCLFLFLCMNSLLAPAQSWNNKRSAVVLTYDDALNVHLDKVVPALDSLKLKGTFFLIGSSTAFTNRFAEWRTASKKHELANHTLFHPCNGSVPGRSFVTADYNLATYTLRRVRDEMRLTNSLLEAVDGKKEHTYAYPCGDTKIGDSLYLDTSRHEFVAARGVQMQFLQNNNVDLFNIGCYSANGQTGEELIAQVKKAISSGSLLVFLFHGVGGEHSLNVSLQAHSMLLHFLKEHQKEVWNPTFIEVAKYIKTTGGAK